MRKLNTGYIPIYLSMSSYCVKSIEYDFPIEFILNFLFSPHHLDLHWVLFPTKVSGQHIPEGILEEARVIVVTGAKKYSSMITTSWRSCLLAWIVFPMFFNSCLLFTKFLQKHSQSTIWHKRGINIYSAPFKDERWLFLMMCKICWSVSQAFISTFEFI